MFLDVLNTFINSVIIVVVIVVNATATADVVAVGKTVVAGGIVEVFAVDDLLWLLVGAHVTGQCKADL